jgi:hypothetical protein
MIPVPADWFQDPNVRARLIYKMPEAAREVEIELASVLAK